jgi:hypothetical protein
MLIAGGTDRELPTELRGGVGGQRVVAAAVMVAAAATEGSGRRREERERQREREREELMGTNCSRSGCSLEPR